jgi:Tfp pilus assembly protein FimT
MVAEFANRRKESPPEMLNLNQKVTETTKQSLKRQGCDRGFSTFELVIVLVVIAVVCAIAIPNATRSVELHRLDGAASLLASKLAEARMNAIKRNRQAWVLVDPAARTMQIQSTDNAGATINVGTAASLPDGVNFTSPAVATQVRFDSLGRLPAGAPAWTITFRGVRNTRTKDVGITVAGRVSVANMAAAQYAE